jgi:hypothetical protein
VGLATWRATVRSASITRRNGLYSVNTLYFETSSKSRTTRTVLSGWRPTRILFTTSLPYDSTLSISAGVSCTFFKSKNRRDGPAMRSSR